VRAWELVRLALSGVRRTPLRVGLTALGIAIASGALASMVAFALGFQEQMEAPLRKLELLNRIQVKAKTRLPTREGPGEQPPPEGFPALDDAALKRFTAIPGVTAAFPEMRMANLEISRGPENRRVRAIGVPPELGGFGYIQNLLSAGRFFTPGAGHQVILGSKLVRDLKLASQEAALGEKLKLRSQGLTPGQPASFRFEDKELEVTVVGIFEPPGFLFNMAGDMILLPLDLMRELPGSRFQFAIERLKEGETGAEGYEQVVVRVATPSEVPRVEKAIKEMGYRTNTLWDDVQEMRAWFLLLRVLLTAVGTVALVVAGLGIINTMLMAVLERTREIGVMKALGATDGDVRVLFLAEAGLVGLLGGLGGLLLGRSVSWVLELGVNRYAREMGIGQHLAVFDFPGWLLAGAVLFAIVVAIGSGVYPASRAARVDPIRALRSE